MEFKSFFLLAGWGKHFCFLCAGEDRSTVHLRRGLGFEGKEFGAVVGLTGSEHGVEGVQEFAHGGDHGLHFEFAGGLQRGSASITASALSSETSP